MATVVYHGDAWCYVGGGYRFHFKTKFQLLAVAINLDIREDFGSHSCINEMSSLFGSVKSRK